MHWIPFKNLTTLCIAALVLTVAGCIPPSPEEQVAATRAQYTLTLTSFTAEEPEPPEAEMEEADEEVGVAVAAEAAATATEEAEESAEEIPEGEEMEEDEESGPRPTDVILHLLVRFGGEASLPGITVEVTQADPFGQEKELTLHWIETAGMMKDDVRQVDFTLEGVEYEDGDAFSVFLRESVPAEERSQYREFSEPAP